jgi:hypothetical protein
LVPKLELGVIAKARKDENAKSEKMKRQPPSKRALRIFAFFALSLFAWVLWSAAIHCRFGHFFGAAPGEYLFTTGLNGRPVGPDRKKTRGKAAISLRTPEFLAIPRGSKSGAGVIFLRISSLNG